MVTGAMGRIAVFCSYAREDDDVRRELEGALAPLRDEQIIDDWYDNRIQAGTRWDRAIGSALEQARLVIFLVSPDLLASSYVREVELTRSLELERKGTCRIVPIVVRQAAWEDSPLAGFQAMPRNARPIEDFGDRRHAFDEVVEGLRAVCKDIVDWENPYKRSQVGDWAQFEHSIHLENGHSVTATGVVELVEKTDRRARAQMEMVVEGQFIEKPMEIDLTVPLEEKFGDFMQQAGQPMPANMEIVLGPSRWEEQVVMIGGRRYETVCTSRNITIAHGAFRQDGTTSTWRSIDVPMDGIVKGEGNLPGWRQTQVLLDFGHGDAATRKPRVDAGGPAPTAVLVGPGRWQLQMGAFGMTSAFDLQLMPDGSLQGAQNLMGVSAPLQGQWDFDPDSNVLQLHLVALMMGMPAAEDVFQIQLTAQNGTVLQGEDGMGRQFTLQRSG